METEQGIVDRLLGLLSGDEWFALAMIFVGVFGFVHVVKIVAKYLPMKRRLKREEIWLVTFAATMVASYFTWPDASRAHWLIIGFGGGPLLNGTYKGVAAFVKTRWPNFYATFNAERSVFSERRSKSVKVIKERRKDDGNTGLD